MNEISGDPTELCLAELLMWMLQSNDLQLVLFNTILAHAWDRNCLHPVTFGLPMISLAKCKSKHVKRDAMFNVL